ncbi:transporter [Rubrimonas sp.]|uniref:transporter n=1 Tax=Rubrimonas sp. TaxID=2036015 RepID=UPI002FDCB736
MHIAPAGPAAALASDAATLAKKLSNPIADLISLPIQFNFDRGMGPDGDGERYLTNIQPVIPVGISDDWNLISRTILPVVGLDGGALGGGSQFGLGDVTQSAFFSPKTAGPGGLIWGVGPVALFPAATDDALGGGKWAAGPTAVALVQRGPWTVGALANHLWSFAGDDSRTDVNASFVQPFVAHSWPTATTLTLNMEMTYDWRENQASPAVNLVASQILPIGAQLIQIGVGARYWLDGPDGGPEGFGARSQLTFLFPR